VGALRSARARTAPADPTERALHHAILQSFATTGRAPSHDELNRITSRAPQVIRRQHDADAIRLGRDGGVHVAYPFLGRHIFGDLLT